MKLFVVINDCEYAVMHSQYTGGEIQITRRSVEVELTAEQIGKLNLRKLGVNSGRTVYETIESVCIVEGLQ
jgi:hypothetical protein